MRTTEKNRWQVLPYFVLIAVYAVFNILLVDKFFPITEGWFQDYANYINHGETMYRDFYLFVPPGYPFLVSVISLLCDNSFLVFRLLGIAERLLLITFAYLILRRLYTPAVSAIGCLAGGVIYIANVQEIFYGYYQTSLLFSTITIWLCIKMYESLDLPEKNRIWSVLAGVSMVLSFMIKQTLGLLLGGALLIVYFFAALKNNKKQSVRSLLYAVCGALMTGLIIAVIMALKGNLSECIHQVFGGAGSKGDLLSVLFGFWPRIINQEAIWLAIGFGIFLATGEIKKQCSALSKRKLLLVKGLRLLVVSAITIHICILFIQATTISEADIHDKIWFYLTVIVAFAVCVVSCCILCVSDHGSVIGKISPVLAVLSFCCLFSLLVGNNNDLWDFMAVRDKRQSFIYALFLVEILYTIYLFFLVVFKNQTHHTAKLLIFGSAACIMYVHGFSFIIEDHSALFAVALIVGEALSCDTLARNLKNGMVCVVVAALVISVFYQRCHFTYHWWGVNETNTVYEATETFDDPHLKGIYASEDTVKPMNEIYRLVNEYKTEDATMYTFPHISYFNVMSGLKSPTFAKVHYFDVCGDAYASEDAAVLLNDPPTFIVWLDFSESTWLIHEDYFRGGERSGQRDLLDSCNTLLNSGRYELLGEFRIHQSDSIYLFHRY